MDLLLTSFGIHTQEDEASKRSVFHRMPPTTLAIRGTYLAPDYMSLLLCDRIIIDSESYSRLTTKRHWSYNALSSLIQALYAEGFVRIEDYSQRLEAYRATIEQRVEQDLEDLDAWRPALRSSGERWSTFIHLIKSDLRSLYELIDRVQFKFEHGIGGTAPMHNYSVRQYLHAASVAMTEMSAAEGDDWTERQILRSYLTYVETNLVLSEVLGAAFYDWSDYQPFYSRKLDERGRLHADRVHKTQQLFEVAFPELVIDSPRRLLRILQDKRIEQLRALVANAVTGKITFDRDFAVRILFEVLSGERAVGRFRSISSYALLPVGFIPVAGTPLQKAAEELAAMPYRSKHAWFYLLTEAKAAELVHRTDSAG